MLRRMFDIFQWRWKSILKFSLACNTVMSMYFLDKIKLVSDRPLLDFSRVFFEQIFF